MLPFSPPGRYLIPSHVCSMFTDNSFALSDSKTLGSVLARLTDLVELNLNGTRPVTCIAEPSCGWPAHSMRRFQRVECPALCLGGSRTGINIGDPGGADLLRFLPSLWQLKSLNLSRLFSSTHALARLKSCATYRLHDGAPTLG